MNSVHLNVSGKKEETPKAPEEMPTGAAADVPTKDDGIVEDQEDVTIGTKIKVIAALLVVGFASYIAYWVQEPIQVRTDVLGSTPTTQSGTQSQTQEISIVNFSFNPPTLNIQKGETVVWTNKDAVVHTVTSDSFASGTLNPGDSFSYTFSSEGLYDYHCSLHPQMKGEITVGALAGQTSQSQQAASTQLVTGSQQQAATQQEAATQQPEMKPAAPETIQPEVQGEPSLTPELLATSQNAEGKLYAVSAPAPAAAGHGAAIEPLSSSVSGLSKIAATTSDLETTKPGTLVSSGPEDFFYAFIFLGVLFLNRKKLFKTVKALK